MINSLRLLFFSIALFLTFGIFAQTTAAPPFSDNDSPIFDNTYLIDNLSNNSPGADVTLRVNKKAPFDCKTKLDCPPSVIVSGSTGNVNMPVDVNVKSLFVGKNQVVDSTGKWVGQPTGLVGPQGPKGDAGPTGAQGIQGPKGDAGAQGPTGPSGPQGIKGDTGPTGAEGPQGVKGDTGLTGPQGPAGVQGPKGDIGPQGLQGPSGIQGPKGDQGLAGPQGLQGPEGPQGTIGSQGIQGPAGATGPQGPKGDSGRWSSATCREVYAYLEKQTLPQMLIGAECAVDEYLLTGSCSISNAGDLRSWTPEFSRGRFSCYGWRRDGTQPLWGDLQATAICCKK